jgi:hypothetical protein
MRRLWGAVIAVSFAVLPACGEDDPAVDLPATTTTTEAGTGTTGADGATGTTGSTVAFPGGTSEVSVAARGGTANLVAVRAARQDTVDRIVFEFDRPVPGYRVRYVGRPVIQDGSGEPIAVEGEAVLEIRLEPAHGPSFTPATSRIKPSTQNVVELVRTGDFEAVVTWVAGLRDRRPFTVNTLKGPGTHSRLMIEVAAA